MITLNTADERAEWRQHRAHHLAVYVDGMGVERAMRTSSDYADRAVLEYRDRLPKRATVLGHDPPPSPGPPPTRDDGTAV